MELRGRFLPSRVYSRWKWTVRFGLLLVPFLVFLSGAGGLILFLTPSTYRSSTLFSLENGSQPQEIIRLLESRGVLERVVERLGLASRLSVDRDSAVRIVRDATAVKIVPDTRLIEVPVAVTDKVRNSPFRAGHHVFRHRIPWRSLNHDDFKEITRWEFDSRRASLLTFPVKTQNPVRA